MRFLVEKREEIKMMKCRFCGKEYIKNEDEKINIYPEFVRKNLEYIADCDCLKVEYEKEVKEMERKRIQDYIKNKIEKFKDISIIDSKFLNSNFENADMNSQHMQLAERYVECFLEKEKKEGLMFYGEVGTGKTFSAACIANYLMEKGKTVLVMNLGLYLNKLTLGWGEAEREVLEEVENCDLMIIDDLGGEKSLDKDQTGWRSEKIYNLIDARYRSEKPLIITTNLDFSRDKDKCKLNIHTQERVRDRIIDMCFPVKISGKSKRGLTSEKFFEFMG